MHSATALTGIILAGGAGRRVGGRDKGLIAWRGKPLVAHVCDRLQDQVATILISCNRNRNAYLQYADTVVADTRADFQGPLAGLEAALPLATTQWVLVAACDTPQLPRDLARRLLAALPAAAPEAPAIAYADDGIRKQYLCAVMARDCADALTAFLEQGGRAVAAWYESMGSIGVDFSDQPGAFRNCNEL